MTATILAAKEIAPAIKELLSGGVVGIPTETVYGLAGDAKNPEAVAKIFAAKDRPHFDPLIVHVPPTWNSVAELSRHKVIEQDKMSDGMIKLADRLISAFWPGPLTILLPRSNSIPDLVTSGLETVGVRMPSHPVAQSLLIAAKTPLAAPSANRFGRISPTTAEHVFSELGDRITYIVDGGACEVGVESTVIAVHDGRVSVLRPGKIGMRDIDEIVKPMGVFVDRVTSILDEKDAKAQTSPGTLASHYAPQKPLFVLRDTCDHTIANIPVSLGARTVGVLMVRRDRPQLLDALKKTGIIVTATETLSDHGDPVEAAKNLFSTMRSLDNSDAGVILCETIPPADGLWYAIADRLTRASQK